MPGPSSTTNSSNNSNTSSNNTATSAPGFQPQASALTNAFNQAGGALSTAQSYGTGPQGTAASLNGNSTIANNGTNLNTAGTNAATTGLGALSNFNAGSTNNPQSIIDAANRYARGQNIGAQTDAAMQQARETARDVALPQVDQNAALSGNSNSSRAGIAQGLVERSLAENAQNTYNDLYSKAYQNGLNLAETQAGNNNTANLTAANAAAGQGTNASNSGSSSFGNSITNTGNANNVNQSNYNNDVNNAYAALQNYMNLIGGKNWGTTTTSNGTSTTNGTGTSNTQNNPGLLSNISSGMGLLGSFLYGPSGRSS